jgi:anti-sigma-K factor RskA
MQCQGAGLPYWRKICAAVSIYAVTAVKIHAERSSKNNPDLTWKKKIT